MFQPNHHLFQKKPRSISDKEDGHPAERDIDIVPKSPTTRISLRNVEEMTCPTIGGVGAKVSKEFPQRMIYVWCCVPASLLPKQDFPQQVCFPCVWVGKIGKMYPAFNTRQDSTISRDSTLHDDDYHHEQIQSIS
jgi:hypothetical protein